MSGVPQIPTYNYSVHKRIVMLPVWKPLVEHFFSFSLHSSLFECPTMWYSPCSSVCSSIAQNIFNRKIQVIIKYQKDGDAHGILPIVGWIRTNCVACPTLDNLESRGTWCKLRTNAKDLTHIAISPLQFLLSFYLQSTHSQQYPHLHKNSQPHFFQ